MSRTSPHLHLPPAAGLRRLLAHRFAPVYLAIVILVTVLLVLGHQTEAGSTALASLHAAISKTASSYSGSSYAGSPEYAAAAAKIAAIPDPLAIHQNFKWYTDAKLRNLAACMAKGDCPANAAKVCPVPHRRVRVLVWVTCVHVHIPAFPRHTLTQPGRHLQLLVLLPCHL